MITVLFDGKCGLCRREISYYRKIAPPDRFRWIDVMEEEDSLVALSINRRDALKAIHVIDEGGHCLTGSDAFAKIWKALPGWDWLGQFVSSPGVAPLARMAYAFFGALRYRFHGYQKCDL